MADTIVRVYDGSTRVILEGADLLAPLVAEATEQVSLATAQVGLATTQATNAATSASAAATSVASVRAEIAARYGLPYYAAGTGIWDLSQWRTMLFQDSAGTTAVTADGDPVGCIKNMTGDADWDLIQTDNAKRPTFRLRQGIPCIEWPSGGGMTRRGGVVSRPIPTFIACAISYESNSVNPVFGFVKNDTSHFHLAYANNAARASISGFSPSRPIVVAQAPSLSLPLNTAAVVYAYAQAGQVEVQSNHTPSDSNSPKATTWIASDVITNSQFGINVTGQSGSGGPATYGVKTGTFFGGCAVLGTVDDRDAGAAWLHDHIDLTPRSTDKVIVGYGASDTDDQSTTTGALGEEMYLRWARDELGPDNPTSSIIYVKVDRFGTSMTGWRVLQTGSTDHRIYVFNMSVGGAQMSFWLGDKFHEFFLDQMPHVDEWIWNQGGNSTVSNPDTLDPGGYMRVWEYMEAFDQVRRAFPTTPHIPFRVHPLRVSPNTMRPVVESLDKTVPLYGDMPVVPDVYQAFLDTALTPGDPSTMPSNLFAADNAHIEQPDGVTLQLDTFAPEYVAWQSSKPAQVAPPLLRYVAEADVDFVRFDDFDSAGDGWTAVVGSGGLIERSAIQVDEGDLASCRIKSGAGGGATYVQWVFDAVPYRGAALTIALRQFLVSGGGVSAGRIQIFSNGTGAVDPNSWVQDLNDKPTGIWRDRYFGLPPVPADATQITLRVWGAATGVAGECFIGRCVAASGLLPKMIR